MTHGTLLHQVSYEEILGWDIHHLVVSIDGTDAESYARVRVGGDCHRLRASLTAFHKARQEAKLKRPLIEVRHVDRGCSPGVTARSVAPAASPGATRASSPEARASQLLPNLLSVGMTLLETPGCRSPRPAIPRQPRQTHLSQLLLSQVRHHVGFIDDGLLPEMLVQIARLHRHSAQEPRPVTHAPQ